ncbi:hypothetical protein Pcinc_036552 [Petrolisthes cinctipes]|uniref:Methylosome subunit pICln n=1 Tax=Petrolisthes cinctipes TaxID=88211 RepID=A0AAE1BUA0_PETCI|nr:hypothetical protein Pcinc_036552 [Petrolisthes cinctipes]
MLLPNEPPPEEGIRHRQSDIQAFVNQTEMGTGTLYIAESRVSWAKDGADRRSNLSFEYPRIAVHAVSRERAIFPHPCLYLMIDGVLDLPEVREPT